MTEIRNMKQIEDRPDRSGVRTLQALDQAAGGSGEIATELTRKSSPPEIRPEDGTDDARCEDSAECDLQRSRAASEVSSKISEMRAAPRSKAAIEGAVSEDQAVGAPARTPERTDREIRAEIEGRLKADRLLNEASIFVTVSRGRVVIEGSVDNHEAKQRAEVISRQASGIVGHDSNLAVRKTP